MWSLPAALTVQQGASALAGVNNLPRTSERDPESEKVVVHGLDDGIVLTREGVELERRPVLRWQALEEGD